MGNVNVPVLGTDQGKGIRTRCRRGLLRLVLHLARLPIYHGSLYHLYSFEMTLNKGGESGKGNRKSRKNGAILSRPSSPRSMVVHLKAPPGKNGGRQDHLEISVCIRC